MTSRDGMRDPSVSWHRTHVGPVGSEHFVPTLDRAAACALAACAFSLGCVVYLFIRGSETLYVGQVVAQPWFAANIRSDILADVRTGAGSLPTAVHTFAFSLATACLLYPGRHTIWLVCLVWAGIDSGLEFLQAARTCPFAPLAFDNSVARTACAYFCNGTFDWLDILSIWTGAGIAFLTLNHLTRVRSTQEG